MVHQPDLNCDKTSLEKEERKQQNFEEKRRKIENQQTPLRQKILQESETSQWCGRNLLLEENANWNQEVLGQPISRNRD